MKTIATHSGGFHADEIFAVATLKIALGEEVEVLRTRNPLIYEKADFVVDVGGVYDPKIGRFDHHQEGGAGTHQGGLPYASFGLLWREYGTQICGSSVVAERIEKRLVLSIDAPDNGVQIYTNIHKDVYPYIIGDLFNSYYPDFDVTSENIDRAFLTCVDIAKDLLLREIAKAKNYVTQEHIVEDIYQKSEEKGIIVLEKKYVWDEVLSRHPEPLFAVYPDIDGSKWSVKGVRNSPNPFDLRKMFPEAWAGKQGKELQELSGVKDATFCHNGRFIVRAESKEGAIKLAQIALNS